jgi:hypothetical protein
LSPCDEAPQPLVVYGNGASRQPGEMHDIIMLALTRGRERTEPEYRALLDNAGFRLTRVVPTESAVSVVEAFLDRRRGDAGNPRGRFGLTEFVPPL